MTEPTRRGTCWVRIAALAATLATAAGTRAETGDFLCDAAQSTEDTCVVVGTWMVPAAPALRFEKPNVRIRDVLRAAVTGMCALEPGIACTSDAGCTAPDRCLRPAGIALEVAGTLSLDSDAEVTARGEAVAGDVMGPDGGTITLTVGSLSLPGGLLSVESRGLASVPAGRAGQITIVATGTVTIASTARLVASTARGGCGGTVGISGPTALEVAGLITVDGAALGGTITLGAVEQLSVTGTLQASNTNSDVASRPRCADGVGGGMIYLQARAVALTSSGSARARGLQGPGGTIRFQGEDGVTIDSVAGLAALSATGGDSFASVPGGVVFLVATAGDIALQRGGLDVSGGASGPGSDAGAFQISASGALRCETSGLACTGPDECEAGEACREVGGTVVVAAPLAAAGGAGAGSGCVACEIRGTRRATVSGAIDVGGGRQGGIGGKVVIAAGGDVTVGPGAIDASAADGGDVILAAGERIDATPGLGGALVVENGTRIRAEGLDNFGGSLVLQGCDVSLEPTSVLSVDGQGRAVGVEIIARERLTVGPLALVSALPDGTVTFAYRREISLALDATVQPEPNVLMDETLVPCPVCGNESVDGVEECDGRGTCGGADQVCLPAGEPEACTCAATCGTVPGIQPGEKCDGADLGGATCPTGGVLACAPDCFDFDTSGCTPDVCGDGIVGLSEDCDPGGIDGAPPSFEGVTCESLGFPLGGALTCTPDCQAIIAGPHCATTVGLACARDADCPGETCVPGCRACGNGFLDPSEECDEGDGNRTAPNHCRPDCRAPTCGDDTVDFAHCSVDVDTPCSSPAECPVGETCVTGEECDQGTAFCVGGALHGQPCCTETDCPGGDCRGDDCSGNRDDIAGCCRCDCTVVASLCGPGVDCDDSNPCTTDSCDPGAGCQHAPVSDGMPCADANLCDGTETCQAGICADGEALGCADGDPCTKDACAPLTGCAFDPMSYSDAIDAVAASRGLAACAVDRLPRGLRRALRRAEALLRKAADAPDVRARRLATRAGARLRSAEEKLARAAARLSVPCAQALEASLVEALGRASCLD